VAVVIQEAVVVVHHQGEVHPLAEADLPVTAEEDKCGLSDREIMNTVQLQTFFFL
jgi:hypothetical protein